MKFWYFLAVVLCCGWTLGMTAHGAVMQDVAEQRYWAGIITVRPVDTPDRVYLVPEVVGVEAGAGTGLDYRAQAHAPLTIRRVMEDSPASRAELLPGDILLEYSGVPLRVHADLVAVIQANQGASAVLRLSRGGEVRELELRPIPRPADYVERVLRDRAAEQAESDVMPAETDSAVVVLPSKLADLLALAAKGAATGEEDTSPSGNGASGEPEAVELPSSGRRLEESAEEKAAEAVNFDRSTRLLLEKLDEFSREWTELLERQRETVRQLSGQF